LIAELRPIGTLKAMPHGVSGATAFARRSPAGGEITILVVDSEPLARRLARRLLSRAGFVPLAAATGEEAAALAVAHSGPLALVIVDLDVADMPAREVAALVRRTHPGLPVIYTDGGQGIARRELGSTAQVVAKPIRARELVRRIEQMLTVQ
jgi:two-component system cell cycle sensor histidine kinase/response regulator CckA